MNIVPESLRSRIRYLRSKYTRDRQFYDKTPKYVRDPIHVSLPENSGLPTKASVSFVYAACVCLTLRIVFGKVSFEKHDQFIRGIYTYFSLWQPMIDNRVFNSWMDDFKIYGEIEMHGYSYYRASRLTKQVSNICKNCIQNNKEIFEMIRELNSKSESWICPNCGGDIPIISHFSVTHLKRKHHEVKQKAVDCLESIPIFLESLNWIIAYLESHPSVVIGLQTLFKNYSSEAEKGVLFATKRCFWCHYDKTKKSKKRWCSLKKEEINKIESSSLSLIIPQKA